MYMKKYVEIFKTHPDINSYETRNKDNIISE